jgi:hypothetical protein
VNGEDDSVIDTLAVLNSANTGIINAGLYAGNYTASGAFDNNYNFTYAAGDLLINKASLLATANGQTITYGTAVPTSTITYTGFVNGEDDSVIDTLAVLNSANTGIINAGLYAGNYTASGAFDNNYDFTYAAGDLTVTALAIPPAPPSLPSTVEQAINGNNQNGTALGFVILADNPAQEFKSYQDIKVIADDQVDDNLNNDEDLLIIMTESLRAFFSLF